MATVHITDAIRNHVSDEIFNLYEGRIKQKEDELNTLGIGEACYEYYFGKEYRYLAQELNKDPKGPWIEPSKKLFVAIKYQTSDHSWETFPYREVRLDPPLPVPAYGRYTTLELLPTMAPYPRAKEICFEINELSAERQQLNKEIHENVLWKCRTLNQVLKLWPTALDFMPPEVREKHAIKPNKRTPVEKAAAIDDHTKVLLMKARMLSTNKGS